MASLQDRPPPTTTAAIAFAAALVAGITGYFIGQAASIGLFSSSKPVLTDAAETSEDESASDDEYEKLGKSQAINDFAQEDEECKLALIVRTDLGMTRGKMAAQCGHATLACYKHFLRKSPDSPLLKRWEQYGQMKVALQVKGKEEMDTLQAQALSLGLVAQIIHDAGRTQIASGSATVLGIGPAPKSVIDQVTGHLKLL